MTSNFARALTFESGSKVALSNAARSSCPDRGFGVDAAGTAGMLARAADTADPSTVRPDLPIYVLSGVADPLAGGGSLVELVADRYRLAGVHDVTLVLYPEARHEVYNETNRDEITAALLD